jgi:NitT/TauT family transport system substrate-binding protein
MALMQTRRRVIAGLAAVTAATVLRAPQIRAAEGALETTTVRLVKSPAICSAPQYIADELLRAEGFTDIRYVEASTSEISATLARGRADFSMNYAAQLIRNIDAGEPLTIIGGVMVGCTELFARDGIRGITDLKGKTVGIQGLGTLPNILVTLMAAHVGLDPDKDLHWVTDPKLKPIELFVDGKIDAFLGFPPEPQDLHARGIGRSILRTAVDRPWSQYYCCMLAGNPGFVRNNPIATKRVMRAILKATDLCATNPQSAAQQLVDGGFTPRYEYALQTMNDNGYDKWREYDPEDAMRFYALRLHDTGLIKSDPKKLIAEYTDWRFFNELKRELKA